MSAVVDAQCRRMREACGEAARQHGDLIAVPSGGARTQRHEAWAAASLDELTADNAGVVDVVRCEVPDAAKSWVQACADAGGDLRALPDNGGVGKVKVELQTRNLARTVDGNGPALSVGRKLLQQRERGAGQCGCSQ